MKGLFGTALWIFVVGAFSVMLIIPETRGIFLELTKSHPYGMGFIKFALLASMGELLAIRIINGQWILPCGIQWKAVIWGVIGMLITLVFQIFAGGIAAAMLEGYLPGEDNKFLFAFFVGSIMNLTFGPVFMAAHKFTDTWLDMHYEEKRRINTMDIIRRIDWVGFVSFVIIKTIPFFWIPAHTITFMLSPEYRVIAAAFLSIALGVILSFAKKNSNAKNHKSISGNV